ncbi:translation initiation factor IF-6 [Desulfurococcaceae archaeon MEX13E-LK6-19]|nr:translation initiation factor IF-6 [Desulfurococcaceae archaeon MEX13E-LK6-19]
MALNRLSILGNPNIGVYVFVNDTIAIVPPGLTENEKKMIMETLNVELLETKIAGTIINGIMVAGNNNAVIVPRNILDEELEYLSSTLKKYGINTHVLESRHTALGNIILMNDKVCLLSPSVEEHEAKRIEDIAGVEVVRKTIMGLSIPGSLAVITNKGGVIHPDVSDEELSELESLLGFSLERATVNSGIPFIKTGLIANKYGALVGELTTGPEIMRIQRGLGVGD